MHSIEESRNYCSYCPKMCHFSCPVAQTEKNENYAPALKQQTAKFTAEKKLPMNAEHALSAYKCLTCRASEEYCDHHIVVADSLQEARERAVKAHASPAEVFHFEKAFKKFNNPYQQDLSKKLKNIPKKYLEPDKKEILFSSCHQLALNPGFVPETLHIFEKLKLNSLKFNSDNLQCCGYSLWVLGFKDEFAELAQIQYNQLKGAKQIVVGSPECAWAMREVYPKIGLKWPGKIVSLFEYVADLIRKVPYKSKIESSERYLYHDACYMGRYLGVYEEPRQLLEMLTGRVVEEFSCNRENSVCSGAGGGYALHSPEPARKLALDKVEEMKKKGIKTLISACPQSQAHFRSLKEKIVVKDLVGFLGEHIE